MKALRQMLRGCDDLPHVGSHPGTGLLLVFLVMGAFAGRHAGIFGILGGVAIMGIVFVPVYLYGAYDRANLSDRLETEARATKETA